MSATLRPYPDYSRGQVAAYPRFPSHWHLTPLKYWININELALPETTDPEYRFRYVDISAVGTGRLLRPPQELVFADAPSRARRVVRRGDTIVSTVRTYLKAVYTFTHDVNDVIASTGFAVLTPNYGTDPAYLGYAVQASSFVEQIVANSEGVAYPAINETRLGSLPVLIAPLQEQRLIARYCAHLDARVNRLVRAKRRLIALLIEQKQAIIQQAVTRGLDQDAPMKPSGVPWLGDIPTGFHLRRFKSCVSIAEGQVDPKIEPFASLPLIAPNHIEKGTGRLTSIQTAKEQGAISGKYLALAGQVLYSKIRPNLQKVTIAPADCLCSADMYALTPELSKIDGRYLQLLLLSPSFTKFAVDESLRAAMPKINREALGNCRLWYPSLEEQRRILDRVDVEFDLIDSAVERASREIQLIREYRTRLVADVVTGQLDVRAAAVALPDIDPLAIADDDAAPDINDLTDDETDTDADDVELPDEMPDAAD